MKLPWVKLRCLEDKLAELLKSCAELRDLVEAKRLHARLLDDPSVSSSRFLGNLVVQMYAKCGSVEDAWLAFEDIDEPNIFSWTILLAAFAHNGHVVQAKYLFDIVMPCKSDVVWNTMVSTYGRLGDADGAAATFTRMPCHDALTWSSLFQGLAHSGQLDEAERRFFFKAPERDVLSWTTLVQARGEAGRIGDARQAFDRMPQWNAVSWTAIVQAHAKAGDLEEAESLFFAEMPEKDVVAWTALQAGYIRHGQVQHARKAFDEMQGKDLTTWTSILTAFTQTGHQKQAAELYNKIPRLDLVAANAVVQMYAAAGDLKQAREMLESLPDLGNVVSWTPLIAAYAQAGQIEDAKDVYDKLLPGVPDLVAQTNMLAAYAQNGRLEEAWTMFCELDRRDQACWAVILGGLVEGLRVQESENVFIKMPVHDALSCNQMMVVYARSGHLDKVEDVFEFISSSRDLVSWNTAMAAYAQAGHMEGAFSCLRHMMIQGVQPDSVTVTSILMACCRRGKLEMARDYFVAMEIDHGLRPTREQYLFMVDGLARSGLLAEAETLVGGMPFYADDVALGALLAACRVHGHGSLGTCVAAKAMELSPGSSSPYVLLSNIYAA